MSASSEGEPWQPRDLMAAGVIILVWGMNFVAMKFTLRYFTPFQLGAARYLFAALPLIFFVRPPKVAAKWLLLFGMFQGVGQFGFLFTAIHVGMTAALASVLMQTQLFFTALLGIVLLKERLSIALRIGLGFAALAIVSFAMSYVSAGAAGNALGFILNLAAAAMWAASNIIARHAQKESPGYDPLAFVVWSALVPILPFVMLSVIFDAPALRWQWLDAPLGSWAGAIYLGWMASVLAYGLWTWLLTRHSANRVAPFGLVVPVVGLTAGVLLLNETLTAWQLLGISLVFAALLAVFATPLLLASQQRTRSSADLGPPS